MSQNPISSGRQRQRGLGAIAAIFVLVMLAALAAAVVRLSWSAQTSFAQDLQGARATQAAQAGIEWGLFKALRDGSWANCAGSQTVDLRTETGFRVTVTCSYVSYVEGETTAGAPRTVKVYTINAVACNGTAASCPDNASAASTHYVERMRQVMATDRNTEE
ncbi:MAG TPA: MSHA biogenesis protein MshP [Aquabacterium sp.]|uniref:MSHA biogenesis protein MshP n=1 Tax=Aquabacterium sp. TaxID=1872578 RepID=UPI002E349601|nr:MSHA biogenesis protein MshP [Aquabacterium sp.]HEX5372928.1 MSHA biogenesis protein MshP [Aquabacterium sp.]